MYLLYLKMIHPYLLKKLETLWTHVSPFQFAKQSELIPPLHLTSRNIWEQAPALVEKLLGLPHQCLEARAPATEFIAQKLENFILISISRGSLWLCVNELWCLILSERTLSGKQGKGWSEENLYLWEGEAFLQLSTWVGRKRYIYMPKMQRVLYELERAFLLDLTLSKLSGGSLSLSRLIIVQSEEKHTLGALWRCWGPPPFSSSFIFFFFMIIIIIHCVIEAHYYFQMSSIY